MPIFYGFARRNQQKTTVASYLLDSIREFLLFFLKGGFFRSVAALPGC